jgi:PAS domain S-box-containing protein
MVKAGDLFHRAVAAVTSTIDRRRVSERQELANWNWRADPGLARLAEHALVAIGTCRSWPLTWRLAVTVAMVLTALALRLTLLGGLEERLAYVTFYPAVAVAAIVGGFSAGALATILSAVLAHAVLAPLLEAADWLGLATFLVSGTLVVVMAEGLHVAQASLAAAERGRQNEQRLRLFIEQAPVAMAMLDQQVRYLAVSDRWMSDYRLQQSVIGRSYYDVFPEIPERWRGVHRRGLAGETINADQELFVRGDGSEQWLRWEVRPWHTSEGAIGGITILSEDITARVVAERERKRAEEAVRASEKRLSAIVDTAVDAIVVIDESGIIQSFNPAARSMFGYAPDEVLGRNVKALMPETFARAHDDYIEAYKRTGVGKIIGKGREVEGRRKDGSTFPVDLAVAEWRDARRQRFFTGTMRDIAARKQAEEALANVRRLEAIGQLAGGIAHDFNNLLAVIAGNLELLEQRIEDDGKRALVRRALDAAEAGASFNRRLLSLARSPKLTPSYVSLNARIEETMKLLRRTLGADISLTAQLATDLWPVLVDPGEIDSALLNIAVNARDAMPQGGVLCISTANVTVDASFASLHADPRPGDYVRLSVVDTGVGMKEEVVRRALEPFFTTKEPGKGTGLGLSSVHSFARQSGGFVTLASELGKGTTVSLYLPRAPAQPSVTRGSSPGDRVPLGGGELVLVVEDDDRVREVTLKRLEALGYAVVEARSGPEAIDLLTTNASIRLVFSDITMPGGLTGYELARWVRTAKPAIKVLLTSGYDRSGDDHDGSGERTVVLR